MARQRHHNGAREREVAGLLRLSAATEGCAWRELVAGEPSVGMSTAVRGGAATRNAEAAAGRAKRSAAEGAAVSAIGVRSRHHASQRHICSPAQHRATCRARNVATSGSGETQVPGTAPDSKGRRDAKRPPDVLAAHPRPSTNRSPSHGSVFCTVRTTPRARAQPRRRPQRATARAADAPA